MQERALALWRGSEPVQGTPAENYLNVRGIVHVATSTIIAVDADPAGDTAARAATLRWQREGRRVRIARPRIVGHDFNDLIHPCGVR